LALPGLELEKSKPLLQYIMRPSTENLPVKKFDRSSTVPEELIDILQNEDILCFCRHNFTEI